MRLIRPNEEAMWVSASSFPKVCFRPLKTISSMDARHKHSNCFKTKTYQCGCSLSLEHYGRCIFLFLHGCACCSSSLTPRSHGCTCPACITSQQPLLFPSSSLCHSMLQPGLMAVSAADRRLSQPKLPSSAVGGSSWLWCPQQQCCYTSSSPFPLSTSLLPAGAAHSAVPSARLSG